MNAILNDKINIAKAVNAEVISLKDAPRGYAEFGSGAKKVCNRPAWNDSLEISTSVITYIYFLSLFAS
jgi:hypothetical protein